MKRETSQRRLLRGAIVGLALVGALTIAGFVGLSVALAAPPHPPPHLREATLASTGSDVTPLIVVGIVALLAALTLVATSMRRLQLCHR